MIPRAVDFFTGKALEYEDLDDDDDYEDVDDDEDDEDEDDDEVCAPHPARAREELTAT